MIAHWKALQQICEGATSHEKLWLKNGWESVLPKVLHFELTWNENAHLHPQSQGLQIYSLHHRCQGSSWSQKVRCVRCMELMHRESSYRMAWGGRLSAPEGREPAVSHNIRHMPSSGVRLYLHKNEPNHVHRTYSPPIFTGASGLNLNVKFVGKWIHNMSTWLFRLFSKKHDTKLLQLYLLEFKGHVSDSEWHFHLVKGFSKD